MEWTVAEARKRFADLLRGVVAEPQAIYNRNRECAVLIDPAEYREFLAWKEQRDSLTLADTFIALADACDDHEGLDLPERGRASRANPILESSTDDGS